MVRSRVATSSNLAITDTGAAECDQSGALDNIRATIGDVRVPLGIDGVAGKASAAIAGVLSGSGTLVVYALMSGEPVTSAPFDLIAKRVVVKGFFLNHPDVELKIPNVLRERCLPPLGMAREMLWKVRRTLGGGRPTWEESWYWQLCRGGRVEVLRFAQ